MVPGGGGGGGGAGNSMRRSEHGSDGFGDLTVCICMPMCNTIESENPFEIPTTSESSDGNRGISRVYPAVGRAKISPYVKSDWRTLRTNYRSKWISIDSHTDKEQGKAIRVNFGSILDGIPPIPKGGHVCSRVE